MSANNNAKTTYITSDGTLAAQPVTVRIMRSISNYGQLVYLFGETLVSPLFSPASWTNPTAPLPGRGSSGVGGGFDPTRPDGGSRPDGARRYMSMGDLGGDTVDGCRSTCG